MICITGGERRLSDLVHRISTHAHYPLQEVRLDLLDRIGEELFPLLRSPRLIVTCRTQTEGGKFTGSESERYQILLRALAEQPGYLDVEYSTPREYRQALYPQRGTTKIILSHHQFIASDQYLAQFESLAAEKEADLLKVAISVEDPADLFPLYRLLRQEQRSVIRIGMGTGGLLSRALPSRFGSPWSYVIPDGALPIAPGQLSVSMAQTWRVSEERYCTPLGVLGGPQVHTSPGPVVYNRLFGKHNLAYLYLPISTKRPIETLALLQELGFAGCSVTMPAKELLVQHLDSLLPPSTQLGAINTIQLLNGCRIGMNTDFEAVYDLFKTFAPGPALILGAGGAARAAAFALHALNFSLAITGRTFSRTQELAKNFQAEALPWEQRGRWPFQYLINATPIGMDGTSSPLPQETSWQQRVVLDMVNTAEPTPLIRQVQEGGGQAIPGLEMWLRQGATQMRFLIGHQFTTEDLREAYNPG